MLSIRALSRSIPRVTTRASAARCRISPSIIRRSPLQSTWTKAATPRFVAAFSTSRRQLAKEGEVDDELAAKLSSELQLEREMRDPEELPVSVKDYLDNGPFQVHDTPGQEEVILTRKFGDENIRIAFSISDLNNLDQDDPEKLEESAMYDEEDEDDDDLPTDGQSGGAQSKSTVRSGRTRDGNVNVARDNNLAPATRPEFQDEDAPADENNPESEQEPSFPANLTITVEKPGKGALQVEAVAQDGMIMIDSVSYYADATLADANTPEMEYARKDMYVGPPFGNLDEDLQVLFERLLDERGINTALALFVPDYVDYKEQKEYLRWLNNVKSFIEA